MPERLGEAEIDQRLAATQWHLEGQEIARTWKRADFADAIGFVNRVAGVAEDMGHHPDIAVHDYRCVTLRVSTHSAGGLTELDFDLARRCDELG
jgi:4a-hydroxytetrahydrobiopterin dehydratase